MKKEKQISSIWEENENVENQKTVIKRSVVIR